MTKQLEALIAEMKAAAEKATPLQLDTAQLKRGNDGWIECPCCEGAGDVEAESDFYNIDGKALGVQFYGIGEHHGLAEQYFRQASPANVLALIAALEQSKHDSAVNWEAATSLVEENEELKRRLAELEALTDQHPVATLYKSGDGAKVIMVGSDLPDGYSDVYAFAAASPLAVKLPPEINPGQARSLFSIEIDEDQAGAAADGWNSCLKAIRAAGGTVEGE